MNHRPEEETIAHRLMELRQEHRDLDHSIQALEADSPGDQLRIKRLKKRKLQLKDAIARMQSMLIPDLDA